MYTSPQLSLITRSGLASFLGCRCSCVIVPNGPAGLIVSFNIRQGLKCKYVASTSALIVWVLCSNYALPWTTKVLGVFSKTRYYLTLAALSPGPKALCWMHKFLRSLAEYLAASAFLCCHYIFDSYTTCFWLLALTLYKCNSIYISCFVCLFIVLNSNCFCLIQIYFKLI